MTRDDWLTDIENAPKDGSEVLFPIEFVGRAYWCSDLKRWVLARPLHMEFINAPARYQIPRGVQRLHGQGIHGKGKPPQDR